MSEHEQTSSTSEAQASQILNAGTGEPVGQGDDGSMIQSDTIKHLDEILANYTAQHIALFDRCQLIGSILSDNPILTDDQCTHAFNLYGGRLEQAAAVQMGAIA